MSLPAVDGCGLAVDVIISNDRHHVAIFRPCIERLVQEGWRCRVLSLCEFRGLPAPARAFESVGARVHALFPRGLRRSPSLGAQSERGGDAGRRVLQRVAWRAIIGPTFAHHLRQRPDVVLMANDAAYPYDRIAAGLTRRSIPFVLFQEGIRFELPADATRTTLYGRGGAAAVAAWGEASGAWFRQRGVSGDRIHLVGSPRFDQLPLHDASPSRAALRARLGANSRTLLFLSNPIDDQGFCSTSQKLQLVRRFLQSTVPLFHDPQFRLVLKLHARESAANFQALLRDHPAGERIIVLTDTPLWDVLAVCNAAVVMASTAGLEALLFDRPLGVLEIPSYGFAHDYVAAGAAIGIPAEGDVVGPIRALMNPAHELRQNARRYLKRNLAVREGSVQRAAELAQLVVTQTRTVPAR